MIKTRQERSTITRALVSGSTVRVMSGTSILADSACLAVGSSSHPAAALANPAAGNKRTTCHTYRTFWNVRHLGRSGAPPGRKPRTATHFIASEAAANPGGLFVSPNTSLDSTFEPIQFLEIQP